MSSTQIPNMRLARGGVSLEGGVIDTITNTVTVDGAVEVSGTVTVGNAADLTSAVESAETVLLADMTAADVKHITFNKNGMGDNDLGISVVGKKIVPVFFAFNAAGAVSAYWKSKTSGTKISMTFPFLAAGQWQSMYVPKGHFKTVAGEDLTLNLSLAIAVEGYLVYFEGN